MRSISYAEYLDKVTGCFIGKAVSGNIGAPHLNGEELASRDFCNCWTAENVHLENVQLKKGDNLLVLRLTRVNDDAKFNIHFCRGMVCDAHITDLASRNPLFYQSK